LEGEAGHPSAGAGGTSAIEGDIGGPDARLMGAAAVLAQIAEGVIVTDRAGKIVLVNEAAERLHGVKRLDVLPDDYTETYHLLTLDGNPYPPGELPLTRAVRGETVVDAHWRIRRPDGTEVLAIGTARPLLDHRGDQQGAILTVRDDTARSEAERALVQSEARYRHIVEGADDFAIVTLDEKGFITGWNHGAELMMGWTAVEAVGQPSALFFTPEDVAGDRPTHEINRAHEQGRAVDERWHMRKDGSRFWGSGLIMRLDTPGAGYLKMFRDRTPEHQADAELRNAEARYREQFENANDFIFTADLQMLITTCNPAVAAAVGVDPNEVIGRSIASFVPEDVLERTQQMLAAKLAGREEATRYEVEVYGRDGERMTWEINSRLTRDQEGNPSGLHAIGRDVSERKRGEDKLRESEARLRALTDHLPGGMVYQIATGADGLARRFIYVSQSHEQMTGIPAEAVLEDPSIPYMLIHPDDRPLLVAAEAEAIRTMSMFDAQARFRRADGELRWCRLISAPRKQPDGSLIWDGIQIDITEQKETEEALRLKGEEFYALADNIPSLCWMSHADGNIFWYNRRWYEYTGTTPQDQAGWGWESVHDPEMLPAVAARWRHSLESGLPFEMTFPLKGADGIFRPFLTRIVPIRDEGGQIVRWFGTNVDISERVEAERLLEQRVAERTAELETAYEQLRQSQKLEAMGQLTGGVAHDFNNLLTPIIGSLDLLQRRGIGDEREKRLIDGAMRSADRAKTLVQRLLAFARRQPLQPAPVDIKSLVEGMADLVASTSGPQVKVTVDVPPGLPAAVADLNQLEMAILNLSVNARDAMLDGGILTISATRQTIDPGHPTKLRAGDYVRLSVADTGGGMDEATAARAIEPFFSTKGIGKGTGLGLSMVHGLASQLGGALGISSKLGLGTLVELWLPASDASAAAPERASSTASLKEKGKGLVLLVDDEELVRLSTADMLADLGYGVAEAGSAEEALRMLDGGLAADILVSDHLMPGTTGSDLAREVMRRRPGMPVLIVSGYADVEGMAPDLPRLTKPFRQADLAASLADVTER
jgi:PAS domain S-box-containing protein